VKAGVGDGARKRDRAGARSFCVRINFPACSQVQSFGARLHQEFWVPTEEPDAFSANIGGLIEVIASLSQCWKGSDVGSTWGRATVRPVADCGGPLIERHPGRGPLIRMLCTPEGRTAVPSYRIERWGSPRRCSPLLLGGAEGGGRPKPPVDSRDLHAPKQSAGTRS
jgi:hypothetical protein